MVTHVFSQIYLHFNWHTLYDQPVLKGPLEQYVQNYIRNRCRQTRGVFYEEVGGADTHVHLAIRCEPFVLVSDFIGEVKGACSFETHKHFKRKLLDWQRGYGVVSFSKKQLPWIRAYIRKQREHHKNGTINDALEKHGEFESPKEQLPKAGSKPAEDSFL